MSNITNLINEFNNQNISLFFENKITSFKPEKEIFINTVNKETPYSDPVKIGYAELKNHEELLVFTCEYNKKLTERSAKKQQFEIAKKVLKEDFKDGAIFIFYDAQGNFRFSFIRRNYGEKGNKKYSTWKRYTYYVSPSETNKTFKERIDKCSYNNLDSIQEAFSVEKLTKEFYNELFAWYQWAISDEVGITFPNDTNTSEDDRIKLEEQIIRLITRLLFVWFIKQKKLVPNTLFDTDKLSKILKDFNGNDKINGNYYNAILQNLFFATLNKEVNEREFAKLKSRDIKTRYRYEKMFNLSQNQIIELFKPIPFLNGGLFECLDKEDINSVKYFLDGFSRNPTKAANGNFRHRAFIPNAVFFDEDKGIIPLLKRYNFTVEENAPNEVQVALDPELLGKVFENLLGAFNPETKETARKQSGSFYTPREIVEYMVTESLATYLTNYLPKISKTTIQQLLQEEELPTELKENYALCKQISNTLRKIKILDPACGSGAFPMGILNKLVHTLEKLDHKKEENIHNLKLHLIEECIYGIDIQTIAVQISKLRFFISLVVEQDAMDISKPENNYNVLTLPNLETKFVAANTLIGIQRKKAGDFVGTLFTDPQIETTKQQLIKIRKQHYYAKTVGAKKRLREQDAILRNKLTKLLQDNNDYAPEDAKQFSQWNPYDQNATSPFFDTEWMFGLQEGFDVVIGNPPYIQMQKDGGKLANLYANQNYTTYQRTGDVYALFYEAGINLLKTQGNINFITSNKWMRAKYGKSLRELFIKNNPVILIDLGADVFENATVDTNIIIVKKEPNQNNCLALDLAEERKTYNFQIYEDKWSTLTDLTNESWIILSKSKQNIKQKIINVGTPLKDWDIQIHYGIKTAFNEAFIIDKFTKEDLINQDSKSIEIIKPILRKKSISRYKINHDGEYLINAHNGLKSKNIEPIDIQTFKPIKKHIDSVLSNIEKGIITRKGGHKDSNKGFFERSDRGLTAYNLRNCAYLDKFEFPKIMWKQTSIEQTFVLDEKGFYTDVSGQFLTFNSKNGNSSLKYLLAILNSKFTLYYMNNFAIKFGGKGVRWIPAEIEKIPIPKISLDAQIPFREKVEQILSLKKENKDISTLEQEIDLMVYKLFNFSYQELLIIDTEFPLTEAEYNNYKIA